MNLSKQRLKMMNWEIDNHKATLILLEGELLRKSTRCQEGHWQCLPRNESREERRPSREKPLLTFSKANFTQAVSPKDGKWQCEEAAALENCRLVSSLFGTGEHWKGFVRSRGVQQYPKLQPRWQKVTLSQALPLWEFPRCGCVLGKEAVNRPVHHKKHWCKKAWGQVSLWGGSVFMSNQKWILVSQNFWFWPNPDLLCSLYTYVTLGAHVVLCIVSHGVGWLRFCLCDVRLRAVSNWEDQGKDSDGSYSERWQAPLRSW